MKVIKKSEIKDQVCECCGSVIQLKHKDLKFVSEPVFIAYKTVWKCPLCKHFNDFINESKKFTKEKTVKFTKEAK